MHMPAPFNRLIASLVRRQGRYAERIHKALIEATTAGLHQELIDLIAAGDDDTVLARLQAGVPPQVLDHEHAPSLIFWAAVYRRHRLIEPLLAAGVDPIRQRDWDPKVIRGSNPFGVPVLAWNRTSSQTRYDRVEPPASTLLHTAKASLLLAAGSLRDAFLMEHPKHQDVIYADWIEDHRLLFHFPGPTSAGVSTGRVALTVPIIARDDPRYPDAMAALSALLRAGVDAAAPLIYALIAGRPDVVRVVVDNAREKEHLAQYICEVALHQDLLPPRQELREIVDIWINSLPGGSDALLSPQLLHRAARAHSIDFLRILIDHARTLGALDRPLKTVDRLLNGINQFVFYEGFCRSEDLEEFRGNTALTEAIVASHIDWTDPESPHFQNTLRVVDLFLEAGADPEPALAMMDFQWPSRDHNAVNHTSWLVRDTAMGQELLVRANAYQSRQDIHAAVGNVEPQKMRTRRM
jgi:hypothetical protein